MHLKLHYGRSTTADLSIVYSMPMPLRSVMSVSPNGTASTAE